MNDTYKTVLAGTHRPSREQTAQELAAQEEILATPTVSKYCSDQEFERLVQDEYAVWSVKGAEYRNGGDRLANFNGVAARVGVTPLQVWAAHVDKHYAAVMEYIRTGREGAEGIESRLVDLGNYARLGRLLVQAAKA